MFGTPGMTSVWEVSLVVPPRPALLFLLWKRFCLLEGGGADADGVGVAAGVSAAVSVVSVIFVVTLLDQASGSVPVDVLWYRFL